MKHRDVKWDIIGEYKEGRQRKAVVFDLGDVVEHGGNNGNDRNQWIDEACTSLKSSVEEN